MGDGTPEELLALVAKWHQEDAACIAGRVRGGSDMASGPVLLGVLDVEPTTCRGRGSPPLAGCGGGR